jgi:hypothetical protein
MKRFLIALCLFTLIGACAAKLKDEPLRLFESLAGFLE